MNPQTEKHTTTPWRLNGDSFYSSGAVADIRVGRLEASLPEDRKFILHAVNIYASDQEKIVSLQETIRVLVEAVTKYKEKYFDRAENQDELTDEAKEIIKALQFAGEK